MTGCVQLERRGSGGLVRRVSLALAFLPRRLWTGLRQITGKLWLLASGAALAACILGAYSRALWPPTTRLTFHLVRLLLQPFFHDLIVQPARMRLATTRFAVI